MKVSGDREPAFSTILLPSTRVLTVRPRSRCWRQNPSMWPLITSREDEDDFNLKVPLPWLRTTNPPRIKYSLAWRTLMRLTLQRVQSPDFVGNCAPSLHSFDTFAPMVSHGHTLGNSIYNRKTDPPDYMAFVN